MGSAATHKPTITITTTIRQFLVIVKATRTTQAASCWRARYNPCKATVSRHDCPDTLQQHTYRTAASAVLPDKPPASATPAPTESATPMPATGSRESAEQCFVVHAHCHGLVASCCCVAAGWPPSAPQHCQCTSTHTPMWHHYSPPSPRSNCDAHNNQATNQPATSGHAHTSAYTRTCIDEGTKAPASCMHHLQTSRYVYKGIRPPNRPALVVCVTPRQNCTPPPHTHRVVCGAPACPPPPPPPISPTRATARPATATPPPRWS